jgi:hypothetical protein
VMGSWESSFVARDQPMIRHDLGCGRYGIVFACPTGSVSTSQIHTGLFWSNWADSFMLACDVKVPALDRRLVRALAQMLMQERWLAALRQRYRIQTAGKE